VVGCCEKGNETSGSIKSEEFIKDLLKQVLGFQQSVCYVALLTVSHYNLKGVYVYHRL
jgi:hypothetical protein